VNNEIIKIGEKIWLSDGPIVDFFSFPYPTRMVVIKLPNDSLWIWSPIQLNDNLKAQISKLGNPAHLVSPNKLHYLFLQEWKQAFPDAKMWALPSTIKKCNNLIFDSTLKDKPPIDWKDNIDQVIVSGSFFMNEIVFFHCASKTAIFADLSENFTKEFLNSTPGWTGWRKKIAYAWKITEPYGWAPLEWRISFINRKRAKNDILKIINLNPDNVIMAHGKYILGNGKTFLEKSFSWLYG